MRLCPKRRDEHYSLNLYYGALSCLGISISCNLVVEQNTELLSKSIVCRIFPGFSLRVILCSLIRSYNFIKKSGLHFSVHAGSLPFLTFNIKFMKQNFK